MRTAVESSAIVIGKFMKPTNESPAAVPDNATGSTVDMRIGALLVRAGHLKAGDVERILAEQQRSPARFGEIAIRLKLCTKKAVDQALAVQFGYPVGDPTAANRIPEKVAAAFNPSSPFVESLRQLRSQLAQTWFDGTPGESALAITSVDRGDGKSFIVANLGVLFSQLGERTLIIDADLRNPTQNQIFNIENRMGLSGILSRRAGIEELIKVPGLDGLTVIPSGPLPPNPSELLSRSEFAALLNEMSSRFDVILVDTPSAQQAADASVIAQRTRAALIVGRKDYTKASELNQLGNILRAAGVNVLGATLNEY